MSSYLTIGILIGVSFVILVVGSISIIGLIVVLTLSANKSRKKKPSNAPPPRTAPAATPSPTAPKSWKSVDPVYFRTANNLVDQWITDNSTIAKGGHLKIVAILRSMELFNDKVFEWLKTDIKPGTVTGVLDNNQNPVLVDQSIPLEDFFKGSDEFFKTKDPSKYYDENIENPDIETLLQTVAQFLRDVTKPTDSIRKTMFDEIKADIGTTNVSYSHDTILVKENEKLYDKLEEYSRKGKSNINSFFSVNYVRLKRGQTGPPGTHYVMFYIKDNNKFYFDAHEDPETEEKTTRSSTKIVRKNPIIFGDYMRLERSLQAASSTFVLDNFQCQTWTFLFAFLIMMGVDPKTIFDYCNTTRNPLKVIFTVDIFFLGWLLLINENRQEWAHILIDRTDLEHRLKNKYSKMDYRVLLFCHQLYLRKLLGRVYGPDPVDYRPTRDLHYITDLDVRYRAIQGKTLIMSPASKPITDARVSRSVTYVNTPTEKEGSPMKSPSNPGTATVEKIPDSTEYLIINDLETMFFPIPTTTGLKSIPVTITSSSSSTTQRSPKPKKRSTKK